MRSIKLLGAIAIAALVVGASAASALATQMHWEAKTYPVKIIAKQPSGGHTTFTTGGISVVCTSTTYTSAEPEFLTGASATILFHPEYSGCTAFGFVGATVTALSGALFLLTWLEPLNLLVSTKQTTGTTGGSITIKASSCEVSVPTGQTFETEGNKNAEGTTVTNITGGKIEANFKVKKITYSSNESGVCPKNGEEATFEGPVVAEGQTSLKAADAIEVK